MNGYTSLAVAITPYYTLLFVNNGNSSVSGIFTYHCYHYYHGVRGVQCARATYISS